VHQVNGMNVSLPLKFRHMASQSVFTGTLMLRCPMVVKEAGLKRDAP